MEKPRFTTATFRIYERLPDESPRLRLVEEHDHLYQAIARMMELYHEGLSVYIEPVYDGEDSPPKGVVG